MSSVGKRIGIGYLLMAALLVGIGAAGLLAADRISDALNRITGPVDTTVRAVDKGIRGVLQQMIGVDMALSARTEKAQAADRRRQRTVGKILRGHQQRRAGVRANSWTRYSRRWPISTRSGNPCSNCIPTMSTATGPC